jgi:hypothetical protein
MSTCIQCKRGFKPKVGLVSLWWEHKNLCSEKCAWENPQIKSSLERLRGLSLKPNQLNALEDMMDDPGSDVVKALIIQVNQED